MEITLDDKSITRGYSLKDDFTIENNKVYQIQQKLKRLLSEGQQINLVPKMNFDEIIEIIREMTQTVKQLYGPDVLMS
jgi:hypothetical protein